MRLVRSQVEGGDGRKSQVEGEASGRSQVEGGAGRRSQQLCFGSGPIGLSPDT